VLPADTSSDSGTPGWVWAVIVVAAAALIAAIPLGIRGRRRSAWRAELAKCEETVQWMSRVLLPQLLQAGTTERAGDAWNVESVRVVAVEDRLTALQPSARMSRARRGRWPCATRCGNRDCGSKL
jgi:hypothetical protein